MVDYLVPKGEEMSCVKCGGTLVGDGYTLVYRCEFVEDIFEEAYEPDAGPIYCDFKETEKK